MEDMEDVEDVVCVHKIWTLRARRADEVGCLLESPHEPHNPWVARGKFDRMNAHYWVGKR